jgi:putative FmdB family regulatory protein
MPIYCYECAECGVFEELQAVGDTPLSKCPQGHPARRVVAPVGFVTTTNPDQENRIAARHYRQNKAAAEGLANGTMMPPADRDVAGDQQSRSSVAQFNSMYDHARKMQ